MTPTNRLGTAFFILAITASFAAADVVKRDQASCNSNEFWYDAKSCCVSRSPPKNPPSPPPSVSCPVEGNWYWSSDKSCCLPGTPQSSGSSPACQSNYGWDHENSKCTPTNQHTTSAAHTTSVAAKTSPTPSPGNCNESEFWWDVKSCCLPNGGPPSPPPPPAGTECPSSGWSWGKDQNCCVPHQPAPPNSPPPQCPQNYSWDGSNNKCSPSGSSGSGNCDSSEFWWEPQSCCLPHGGQSNPPPPPPNTQCPPSGWSWGGDQGCCVPQHPPPPNSPPPQCPPGWTWEGSIYQCQPTPSHPTPPPPKPSGYHNRGSSKRTHKSRQTLCPAGLDACPIAGLTGDYECIDTNTELESCGGCSSIGLGQDCTAIKGAWNVGCENGVCAIYSCASGYKLSADGKSCIAV